MTLSASSSAAHVLVAVAHGRAVGVDIEASSRPFPLAIDDPHVFVPTERWALRNADPTSRDAAAYSMWTRKEAVLKCVGQGLDGLNGLDCADGGPEWRAVIYGGASLFRRDLSVRGYAAAVAVADAPATLVVHSQDRIS